MSSAGFALYGGTALALRLAHRASIDFDFFSSRRLDRKQLAHHVPLLAQSPAIQDEADTLTVLVRFDIDSEGGGAAWIEAELPAPNLVVVNPRNGHAHLIYLLGGWIRTDFGDPSRLKVVRYAAAIERAYAAALGADNAYSGRFHHNPLSAAYVTKVGWNVPYSLAELAQYVDLATPAVKPVPLGIGRNVEVFDRLLGQTTRFAESINRDATSKTTRSVNEVGRLLLYPAEFAELAPEIIKKGEPPIRTRPVLARVDRRFNHYEQSA